MPYKRKGKIIWHKKNNRWSIKQRCTSIDNAKAAMRLLGKIASKEK